MQEERRQKDEAGRKVAFVVVVVAFRQLLLTLLLLLPMPDADDDSDVFLLLFTCLRVPQVTQQRRQSQRCGPLRLHFVLRSMERKSKRGSAIERKKQKREKKKSN